MANVIIVLVLVLICAVGVLSYRKRLKSGCCGAGGDDVKKVKVADKDPQYYPYSVTISVDGMVCANCVLHVENALNELGDVWAKASLEKKNVVVRMKTPHANDELRRIIRGAGYLVTDIQ